jgi:spoIIIJ-associated protein
MDTKKSIEAEGKTPDEAIAKGLAQLGLSSDDVIIEILKQTTTEARVRLTPFPSETVPSDGAMSEATSADPLAVSRDVLEHLLTHMGIRTQVEATIGELADSDDGTEPPIMLNITGNDLSLLIGRKGETLTALQMMTRLIVSQTLKHMVSIVVDVEHYKQHREESLRNLALRMAEQAQAKGRTVSLEPMPPHERRIIHIALRDHTWVTTQSIGEGESRKVTIIPKK